MARKRTNTPLVTTSQEAIKQKLRDFRVSGMAQALPARLDQARTEGFDYLELSERLLDNEMDKR